MKLFLFEWKKNFKKKTTWILLALSVLATIGIYFFHFAIANSVQNKVTNDYDFLINLYLQDAEHWKLEKENAMASEDEDLIEEAIMMEESSRYAYEHYQKLKKSYQNDEWEVLYKDELDMLEFFAYPPPEEPALYVFENTELANFTLRATYEETKYLMENQIEPFIQNTTSHMLLPTAYDDFSGSSLKSWEEETTRYGKQGIYYIYLLIKSLYIPIIILIGCFIFGNTLSSETTKKNNGIRFHQVLPLNRSKLFFAKYLTGYSGTIIFVIIMIGVPLLVGTFMNGFGDLDYPILVYDGYTSNEMTRNAVEDTFHFITLQDYLVQTIIFAIVMSLLIYSMYYLVSLFIKEPIFNVIITGIISFVGSLWLNPYNPFSYMNTDIVITHEIQLQTWDNEFSYLLGIIVTLVLSSIFITLNYFGFRDRFN